MRVGFCKQFTLLWYPLKWTGTTEPKSLKLFLQPMLTLCIHQIAPNVLTLYQFTAVHIYNWKRKVTWLSPILYLLTRSEHTGTKHASRVSNRKVQLYQYAITRSGQWNSNWKVGSLSTKLVPAHQVWSHQGGTSWLVSRALIGFVPPTQNLPSPHSLPLFHFHLPPSPPTFPFLVSPLDSHFTIFFFDQTQNLPSPRWLPLFHFHLRPSTPTFQFLVSPLNSHFHYFLFRSHSKPPLTSFTPTFPFSSPPTFPFLVSSLDSLSYYFLFRSHFGRGWHNRRSDCYANPSLTTSHHLIHSHFDLPLSAPTFPSFPPHPSVLPWLLCLLSFIPTISLFTPIFQYQFEYHTHILLVIGKWSSCRQSKPTAMHSLHIFNAIRSSSSSSLSLSS